MSAMLPLDSPRWKELTHAYGSAEDVPKLLMRLELAAKPLNYQDEPWFSLWSALCHQGDVYTATYAAVPYFVKFAEVRTPDLQLEYLNFIGCVEASRAPKEQPPIPADLAESYQEALRKSRSLFVKALGEKDWNEEETQSLIVGLAAVLGHGRLGYMIMQLDQCNVCGQYFAMAEVCEHARDLVQ